MKSALIVACVAFVVAASSQNAGACGGRLGRGLGGNSMGRMMQAGMAAMRMVAAQEQYAAAQRAEAHSQHIATYSSLREKQLAERETRRQARLGEQTLSSGNSTSASR